MRLKKLGPWMAMLILLGWASLFSQTIRVTGSWALSIDSSNLPGPGSDLPDSFESDPDQIEIDVHGQKLEEYQVSIQRSDVSWNPYFRVYARRTSDGTGSGYISGGTNYGEASTTSQEFFRGGKNRSNIAIQLRLSGVTVAVEYGTYITHVVYTITQL